MPVHHPRPVPSSPARPAATFTAEDVAAFRLRPLGHLGTITAFSPSPPPPPLSAARGTHHSAPTVAAPRIQNSRYAATLPRLGPCSSSTIAKLDSTHACITTITTAKADVVKAAAPRVYAALVPPPPASADTDTFRPAAITVTATASMEAPPRPLSADIPPPTLTPAAEAELNLWTRKGTNAAGAVPMYTMTTTTGDTDAESSGCTTMIVTTADTAWSAGSNTLHHWWRERQQGRLQQRHAHSFYDELMPSLSDAVAVTLAAEESFWQQQQQTKQAARLMEGVSTATVSTAIPPVKMEVLLRAVQKVLHQTTLSFLEAEIARTNANGKATRSSYNTTEEGDATIASDAANSTAPSGLSTTGRDEEEKGEGEADDRSRDAYMAILQESLRSERELLHEATITSSAQNLFATPSLVTVPPERLVPPPVLRMEAAVAVSVLTRLIEQVTNLAPGMALAAQLLHQYVLPHMYMEYAAWSHVRPTLGSISEQVAHLSSQTLRIEAQQGVLTTASQARLDNAYLESIVRAWTMRSWLRHVTQQRQRLRQLRGLETVFAHLHDRTTMQHALGQWRRRYAQAYRRRQEADMTAAFDAFVCASKSGAAGFIAQPRGPGLSSNVPLTIPWATTSTTSSALPTAPLSVAASVPLQLTSFGARTGTATVGASASRAQRTSTTARRRGVLHSHVRLSVIRRRSGLADQPADGGEGDGDEEATVERYVMRNPGTRLDGSEDEADGDALSESDDDVMGCGDDKEGGNSRRISAEKRHGKLDPSGAQLVYLDGAPRSAAAGDVNTTTDASSISPTPTALGFSDILEHPGHTGGIGTGASVAASALFTAMMTKLSEMEEVNAYLRRELTVHSRRVRKLEGDNRGLRQRNDDLTAETLRLVKEKLDARNAAQEQDAILAAAQRRLRQLRSRLRAHGHRPWQRAVMRLVGDVSAVSTFAAEQIDEATVVHDQRGPVVGEMLSAAFSTSGAQAPSDNAAAVSGERLPLHSRPSSGDTQRTDVPITVDPDPQTRVAAGGGPVTEEERLFGAIAPIVLHSTRQLPDALVILADWANGCLDDLQQLDDLTGGPLSVRFQTFGEEARSGLLFSRLLYYLALPRYHAPTSVAEAGASRRHRDGVSGEDPGASSSSSGSLSGGSANSEDGEGGNGDNGDDGLWGAELDPRQQLLAQQGVQLSPPYPVYEHCFGDILGLAPVERMTRLLNFATELLASLDGNPDAAPLLDPTSNSGGVVTAARSMAGRGGETLNSGEARSPQSGSPPPLARAPLPPGSTPLPLHTVIDPFALVRGDTGSVVTFVALLYVRFAHPFQHKCRAAALVERRMLLELWSEGTATAAELADPTMAVSSVQAPVSKEIDEKTQDDDKEYSCNTNKEVDAPVSQLEGVDAAPQPGDRSIATASDTNDTLHRAVFSPTVDDNEMSESEGSGAFMEAAMLRRLVPDDKTPWQLFSECCLPVLGTKAHAFLLRGGFWPAQAFDTPELAAMLAALAMALRRSLELHRWHVTMSCLVPVRTYSGLTRGVFTGPAASAVALDAGLRQDGRDVVAIDTPMLLHVLARRREEAQQAGERRVRSMPPALTEGAELWELSTAATDTWRRDLLTLFLQRSTLSPLLLLPVLDLGSWRLLCSDLGLIDMRAGQDGNDPKQEKTKEENDDEQQPQSPLRGHRRSSARVRKDPLLSVGGQGICPVDLDSVTHLFQRAVIVVAQMRNEVDPAVLRPRARPAGGPSDMAGGWTEAMEEGNGDSPAELTPAGSPTAHGNGGLDIQMDMTYESFVVAVVLLANDLFPGTYCPPDNKTKPSGDGARIGEKNENGSDVASRRTPYCSYGDAFEVLMTRVVLAGAIGDSRPAEARHVLRDLTRGLGTQLVLHSHAPGLMLVYQAYSKDVLGDVGLLREDVLRLLRDAMLTNADLSQYVIYDLFANCAVLREAREEGAMRARRDMDARARLDGTGVAATHRRPGYRAVRIMDPATMATAAAEQRKRAFVLTFDGFCDLVCVLCTFKQPNVFVPFEERLALFLRRSLLRPLAHTVAGLAAWMAESQAPATTPAAAAGGSAAGAAAQAAEGIKGATGRS